MGIISFAVISTSVTTFAGEIPKLNANFTEEYLEWNSLSDEEKENTIIPRISVRNIPEKFNLDDLDNTHGLREQVVNGIFEKNAKKALVSANGYQFSRYRLDDKINVNVKNQENTNECWAFSMTSALETNLALTKNIVKRFSPRHMDYSLVRTFTDGVNQDTFNRTPRNRWTS